MGFFTDLLKDFPSLSVAKERLSLLDEKYKTLETENGALRHRVADLESRLAHHETPNEYQRRDSVDWKRDTDGIFSDGPRCPDCKLLMSKLMDTLKCTRCGYEVYQGSPPLETGTMKIL